MKSYSRKLTRRRQFKNKLVFVCYLNITEIKFTRAITFPNFPASSMIQVKPKISRYDSWATVFSRHFIEEDFVSKRSDHLN